MAPGQAAAVKFLRHLAAVAAVVAVVVLIGLAWDHLGPGSLPGEGPGGVAVAVRGQLVKGLRPGMKVRLAPGLRPVPGLHLNGPGNSGIPGIELGDLLEPGNLAVLRSTAFIEAAVIAGVVLVDASYRKWRRAKRVS
jgi:hypothetical protein